MWTKSAPASSMRRSSSPMRIQSAVMRPTLRSGRPPSAPGALPNRPCPEGAVDLERLLCRFALVNQRDDRPHHPLRVVAFEDVAAHGHPGRALTDGLVRHGEGIELWQLLSTGHDDGHWTRRGHRLEVLLTVVGLNELSAELRDDAAGKAQVSGVAGEL